METDEKMQQDATIQHKVPHGFDVYKEDLEGELWWLKDNDCLIRGYRTQLSFKEALKRFVLCNEGKD